LIFIDVCFKLAAMMWRGILFFFLAVPGFSQDWSALVDSMGPDVAKVEIYSGTVLQSSGSAFAIGDGKLLTSAHVVSDERYDKKLRIQLKFPASSHPDQVFEAKIVQISEELDLAILSADVHFAWVPPFATEDKPRLMSDVLVLGYPLGLNFKATPGVVQAFQDVPELGTMLDLSASVDPGNSGGPVVAKNGSVLGIVTSRIVGRNFNLALPIKNVVDFLALSEHPVTFQVATTPSEARVYVNGIYKGTSPVSLSLLSSSVEISVEKDGFETAKRTVRLENGAMKDQSFDLVATATTTNRVTIVVEPVGAKIWVDNSARGAAPLQLNVDKGTRLRLRVEAPGYEPLSKVVDLEEGDQTIRLVLKKSWF
jgi:S1-C subfamily serine protease